MEEYQITGVIRYKNGNALKVLLDGSIFRVRDICNWIEKDGYTFFTLKDGKKAVVHTGQTPAGRKYLTTHPDGVTENHLDELVPIVLNQRPL